MPNSAASVFDLALFFHWRRFPGAILGIGIVTSHFVLAVMALVGTGVHLVQGRPLPSLERIFSFGIPAVAGAQVGAALSTRIHEHWITRSLGLALILVGVRLVL